MSMCRVISCVVGRRCLLWSVCSLGKTLLAFVLLHSVLQGQTCLLLQVSPDFLLLHSNPLWWKGHLFGTSSRRTYSLLDGSASASSAVLVGAETCVTMILNGLPWKWTEIILPFLRPHEPKYWILDSSVDYEGYSISSMGFLPTVVDVMVIWIKFTHSVHSSSLIPKMSVFSLAISCLTTLICLDSWTWHSRFLVHPEKRWTGRNTSWNQDCWEKYQ